MTYTVLGWCRESGEIGIASATVSIAVGARLGQWVVAGECEWMIASQAVARPGLGFEAGDLLASGTPLDHLGSELAKADPHLAYRQIGVIAKDGPSYVYTGVKAHDWKGHVAGDDFVVLGNFLAGPGVVVAMAEGFSSAPDAPLAERLIRALEGGRDAGGQADADGNHEPELSAFVRVFNSGADTFVYGGGRSPVLDLRVDYDTNAVEKLRQLYEDCRPLRAAYELRANDPEAYLDRAARWEMDLFESRAGDGR
jgi:uncharacterized Ntn-hydrolase superfamily protein